MASARLDGTPPISQVLHAGLAAFTLIVICLLVGRGYDEKEPVSQETQLESLEPQSSVIPTDPMLPEFILKLSVTPLPPPNAVQQTVLMVPDEYRFDNVCLDLWRPWESRVNTFDYDNTSVYLDRSHNTLLAPILASIRIDRRAFNESGVAIEVLDNQGLQISPAQLLHRHESSFATEYIDGYEYLTTNIREGVLGRQEAVFVRGSSSDGFSPEAELVFVFHEDMILRITHTFDAEFPRSQHSFYDILNSISVVACSQDP